MGQALRLQVCVRGRSLTRGRASPPGAYGRPHVVWGEEAQKEGRAVPFLKHFLGLFWAFFLSFPLGNLTFFRSKLSPWFTTFFSRSRAHSLKMVHGLARAGAHQPSNLFYIFRFTYFYCTRSVLFKKLCRKMEIDPAGPAAGY